MPYSFKKLFALVLLLAPSRLQSAPAGYAPAPAPYYHAPAAPQPMQPTMAYPPAEPSFFTYYIQAWQKFADFDSRASRKEYLSWWLAHPFLTGLILLFIEALQKTRQNEQINWVSWLQWQDGWQQRMRWEWDSSAPVWLMIKCVELALEARRLQDLNLPGVWACNIIALEMLQALVPKSIEWVTSVRVLKTFMLSIQPSRPAAVEGSTTAAPAQDPPFQPNGATAPVAPQPAPQGYAPGAAAPPAPQAAAYPHAGQPAAPAQAVSPSA